MKMKKFLYTFALLLLAAFPAFAQQDIRVEAPSVVAVDEQFNVTFIIEDEKNPSDFSWSAGDDFQLVWGPQKGSSTSVQIINGKRSSSHQTTYTYILLPKSTGTFRIPSAYATLRGERIASPEISVQVVSDGAESSGQGGSGQASGDGSAGPASVTTGDISGNDLFLRLSLNRSEVVIGEPVSATLKLYQRVNIAGFENAKFPSFNGFWSQETYSPTNIEFKRESFDDKIYNTAVLRSYVLIPQQAGTITIDPAELVCLVNIRAGNQGTGSIFDSFFQDEYRTIRKRVTTPALKVKVNPLPAGQPASFGGGVGSFGISSRLTSDELKTHDAASLIVTISGRGNVSLLEEPKVNFPHDFEVYDTKATENTDKSTGGTSGSKSFEYPFIPRSHGEFTIDPIEYSYYDVSQGRYITLKTEPVSIKVAKGKGSDAPQSVNVTPGVERAGVQSLANDIRFISMEMPRLSGKGSFFLFSLPFWIILFVLLGGTASIWFAFRRIAAMRADVAGSKNRRATKMARKRLKVAGDFLDKNLYSAFYEELHKALLGFASDKLNMDMSEISKESIAEALTQGGAGEENTQAFTGLLDACEFARYAPDAGHEAMRAHYEGAVEVISAIDSSFKKPHAGPSKGPVMMAVLLTLGLSFHAAAQEGHSGGLVLNVPDSSSLQTFVPSVVPQAGTAAPDITAEEFAGMDEDSLWMAGTAAYSEEKFAEAAVLWQAIVLSGKESPVLYYNIGNACFKAGNYPEAILNYERALKLDPSYSDARYNLEFTNTFVRDKIDAVPEFILKSWGRKACYLLDSDAWAVLFLVFLAIALVMLSVFLLSSMKGRRKAGFYCGIVFVLLSLFSLWFSAWQKLEYKQADEAIVMSPVSSVKSSPSGGKDLFVLHEGTKVKVLDAVGGWNNISLADGRQGWMKAEEIERI